jgi:hypothetical protein
MFGANTSILGVFIVSKLFCDGLIKGEDCQKKRILNLEGTHQLDCILPGISKEATYKACSNHPLTQHQQFFSIVEG